MMSLWVLKMDLESRDKKMNAKSVKKKQNCTLCFPAAGEKEVGNGWRSNALSRPVLLLGGENVAGSQAMSSAQGAVIMQEGSAYQWNIWVWIENRSWTAARALFTSHWLTPLFLPLAADLFFLFVFLKPDNTQITFPPQTLCSSLFSYLTALVIRFLSYLLECRLSGEHVRLFTPAALSLIGSFSFSPCALMHKSSELYWAVLTNEEVQPTAAGEWSSHMAPSGITSSYCHCWRAFKVIQLAAAAPAWCLKDIQT